VIFLDANYFLRYLVEPDGPDNQIRHEIAAALFEAIELGEEEATTSEAALAEVAFILASKRQYNLSPADIATYLSPIIRLPGLRLPRGRKGLYLRALEI
jgi:predicted nucleic acid-binding protein